MFLTLKLLFLKAIPYHLAFFRFMSGNPDATVVKNINNPATGENYKINSKETQTLHYLFLF